MRDLAVTCIALALCVAGMRGSLGVQAIAPGEWISIAGTRDGVHESVRAVAGVARARGLVPVLYLRADYTFASANLQAMRDTPPMRRALAGIAVISIDPYDDDSPYFPLQTAYWHSFHALDGHDEPTGPILEPGTKEGPCASGDPVSCAAWISPFLQSLR